MTGFKKIMALVVAIVIVMTLSMPVKAQFLNKKPGTIKEQIANSPLFNDDKVDTEIEEILNFATKFKGVRYKLGATGPSRFDCSGFTSYVFSNFGYKLSRTSREQVNNGKTVEKSELLPGDLVFFNGRRAGGTRIGHVGIVTSVDTEKETFEFIHASCSQGVVVSKSTEPYYKKRYVMACRVVEHPEADQAFDVCKWTDFDYYLYMVEKSPFANVME